MNTIFHTWLFVKWTIWDCRKTTFILIFYIDFSFVEDECRKYFSLRGRKGENPLILFKMLLFSFMFDLSERSIEEHCNLNLNFTFKYFLSLEVDEKVAGHSTWSKFRGRIGVKRFTAIFYRIVEQTRQKGLVSD